MLLGASSALVLLCFLFWVEGLEMGAPVVKQSRTHHNRERASLVRLEELSNATVLVTGGAGFIGYHLSKRLLGIEGSTVVVLDNFNDYYDVRLKEHRAHKLHQRGARVLKGDICDAALLEELFAEHRFTHVANLAAQAGVKYSVNHPDIYAQTNINCFLSILEILRVHPETKLVYASSSSVYGKDARIPFSEEDCSAKPTNLYGVTKRADELMAHAYHHLFALKSVGLRFFTVYGPWGRPDMAPYIFTKAVLDGQPLTLSYANGTVMQRDFTFIDDVVEGMLSALVFAKGHDVFNLGRGQPVPLPSFIEMVEKSAGVVARSIVKAEADGAELVATYANISKASQYLGYEPTTLAGDGVEVFVRWYRWYEQVGSKKAIRSSSSYAPHR